MPAKSLNFSDFIVRVQDLDPDGIICLADQAATDAERRCYSRIAAEKQQCPESRRYADTMKNLIRYLRYGVKPRGLSETEKALFLAVKTRFESQPTPQRPISKKQNFLPAQIIPFRGIIH